MSAYHRAAPTPVEPVPPSGAAAVVDYELFAHAAQQMMGAWLKLGDALFAAGAGIAGAVGAALGHAPAGNYAAAAVALQQWSGSAHE